MNEKEILEALLDTVMNLTQEVSMQNKQVEMLQDQLRYTNAYIQKMQYENQNEIK